MRIAVSIMVAAAILSGCASTPPEEIKAFDTVEHAPYREVGNGEIRVHVSVTNYDGSSAREMDKVYLVPATSFYRAIFDHLEHGVEPKLGDKGPPPGWESIIRETKSDYSGRFVFSGLPAGSWYVIAGVKGYKLPYSTEAYGPEGYGTDMYGSLMQEVRLGNGETKRVTLSGFNITRPGIYEWVRPGIAIWWMWKWF